MPTPRCQDQKKAGFRRVAIDEEAELLRAADRDVSGLGALPDLVDLLGREGPRSRR